MCALREVAQDFAISWLDHNQAIDDSPLPYLDVLMEEIAAVEPITLEQLSRDIAYMVRHLGHGAAQQLVGLKYPELNMDDLVPART
jgi:hypothetical protein